MSAQTFIAEVFDDACRAQLNKRLPAAAMIAESGHESGWGEHGGKDYQTGQDSKNLFGIKGVGPAGSVRFWTEEEVNGVFVPVLGTFRAYNSYQQSFEDYADLITGDSRYAPAVAASGNPEEYVRQLQKCGYATNENYANDLIEIMHDFNLIQEVNTWMATNVPQQYQIDAVNNAIKAGLLKQYHDPLADAPIWFVCQIMLNLLALQNGTQK